MDATSLSNTNSTKILELEDELASSLRDAIAERDEIEIASFNEDEVLALTAICSRLAALVGNRDMIAWMEEDEGGKQSSAWDIISALSERGRLGYKEEEMVRATWFSRLFHLDRWRIDPKFFVLVLNGTTDGRPGFAGSVFAYPVEGKGVDERARSFA